MSNTELQLDVPIIFHARPVPVQGTERIEWRLGALALVLARCRDHQASVGMLQTLLWALESERSRAMFLAWWQGRRAPLVSTHRTDPRAERTVDLALGSEIVTLKSSGKVKLTDIGEQLAVGIGADDAVLSGEKAFLARLPSSITEAAFQRNLGWTT